MEKLLKKYKITYCGICKDNEMSIYRDFCEECEEMWEDVICEQCGDLYLSCGGCNYSESD